MASSSTPTPLHHNRWVHLALGLTVSIGCLWYATRGLLDEPDAFSKAGDAFARADYRTLPLIMIATAVFYWFKACRWRLLLSPIGDFRISRDLYPYVMIGFGFNNLLPVHMGEVMRAFMFAKHAHVKVSAVVTSVVLERIFDSVSVLTLLCVGLAFVPGLSPEIRTNTMVLAICVAFLVLALVMYVLWTQKFIAIVTSLLSRVLSQRLLAKLTGVLESGATGLAALKNPRLVAAILALSMGNWVVNGMVIHLALWSFGLPNSLLISCIVLGLTAIGAAVPSAPGYFGVIQLCFMTVLTLFTDDEAGIFAASIYYHLTEYIIVTLVGLYYFNTTGITLAEVELEAKVAEAEAARDEVPGEQVS